MTLGDGAATRPMSADGLCADCGANDWQLVEEVQQWHRGAFVSGSGFVFEGNHEWDQISAEGSAAFVECRVCMSKFSVPDYSWA